MTKTIMLDFLKTLKNKIFRKKYYYVQYGDSYVVIYKEAFSHALKVEEWDTGGYMALKEESHAKACVEQRNKCQGYKL